MWHDREWTDLIMSYGLNQTDVAGITVILRQLLIRSEASGCMVCDFSGFVLVQEGFGAYDPVLISALGAGVFAATRELARLLGENEFSAVIHQGERRSLLICAINRDVLLTVIFSDTSNLGLVKLYSKVAVAELQQQFAAIASRGETERLPERVFTLNDPADWFKTGSPEDVKPDHLPVPGGNP